jgi:hypothetical protein
MFGSHFKHVWITFQARFKNKHAVLQFCSIITSFLEHMARMFFNLSFEYIWVQNNWKNNLGFTCSVVSTSEKNSIIMLQRCFTNASIMPQKCFIYAPIMPKRSFINGILAWLKVMFSILYVWKMIWMSSRCAS